MSVIINEAIIEPASGTAANWTSENPTLNEGEVGYETDTKFWKRGDGSTAWNSLDYQPNPAEVDGKATLATYSTAWINRSDWTNVHIGTDDTKNADSNVTHSLSANLTDLIVKLYISSDGTDANAIGITTGDGAISGGVFGTTVTQEDTNNIKIQTGGLGLLYIDDNGANVVVDTEDWYYKIKVYKLS